MGHRQGQSRPTMSVADAETLAQIEQNKREALLKRTSQEVGPAQLHPFPTPQKTVGQQLKGRGSDPKANLDEGVQSYRSYLTLRHRFTTKVVGNAGHGPWKRRNQSGRDHHHRRSRTFAIVAGNASNPRKQNASAIGERFVRKNSTPLFVAGHRQRVAQFLQLTAREPGNVRERLQASHLPYSRGYHNLNHTLIFRSLLLEIRVRWFPTGSDASGPAASTPAAPADMRTAPASLSIGAPSGAPLCCPSAESLGISLSPGMAKERNRRSL